MIWVNLISGPEYCFGMRGGNSTWTKEQDRRSFCAGLTVECLACNEGAEDRCAQG